MFIHLPYRPGGGPFRREPGIRGAITFRLCQTPTLKQTLFLQTELQVIDYLQQVSVPILDNVRLVAIPVIVQQPELTD